jgi:hypothetical protein
VRAWHYVIIPTLCIVNFQICNFQHQISKNATATNLIWKSACWKPPKTAFPSWHELTTRWTSPTCTLWMCRSSLSERGWTRWRSTKNSKGANSTVSTTWTLTSSSESAQMKHSCVDGLLQIWFWREDSHNRRDFSGADIRVSKWIYQRNRACYNCFEWVILCVLTPALEMFFRKCDVFWLI